MTIFWLNPAGFYYVRGNMNNKANGYTDVIMENTGDSFYSTMLDSRNDVNPEPEFNPFLNEPIVNDQKVAARNKIAALTKQLAPLQAREVHAQKAAKAVEAEIRKLSAKLNKQKQECLKLRSQKNMLELQIEKQQKLLRE